MTARTVGLLLALGACGLGDDRADGSRAQCAEGGALDDTCAADLRTAEQACWRLVDCGAISLHENGQYAFDWNRCVREVETAGAPQQRLIMACIAASTCDQLKVRSSDGTDSYDRPTCLAFGEN